jgi:hypothetical protein
LRSCSTEWLGKVKGSPKIIAQLLNRKFEGPLKPC